MGKPATSTADWISQIPNNIEEDITEADAALFAEITRIDLTPEQQERILTPPRTYPRQESVLAVHWHPEFIPMDLLAKRIDAAFPNRTHELIIPTQHNQLTTYGAYTGVEVDCYSKGFNQKVQLLLHFPNQALDPADRLKNMLHHTFQYRSRQLFEFMESITRPMTERIDTAAEATGANEALIHFVTVYVRKIKKLLAQREADIPPIMVKNKLLRNFFDGLRPAMGDALIDRAQVFLKAVKQIVKSRFSLRYFYRTSEVIEEARSLGGGILIPHPEQFWPILLADYDVDGIEVWNPQSRRYTDFLISVIQQKNENGRPGHRPLLITMGDDTHLGEKVRDPAHQDPEKARREIGVQPAWDDFSIRKSLMLAGIDRRQVIEAYQSRLDG